MQREKFFDVLVCELARSRAMSMHNIVEKEERKKEKTELPKRSEPSHEGREVAAAAAIAAHHNK